ncbi:hypothetical protein EFP84_00215 [Leptospira kmetyi]|uniref:Uncharacterized protein n=1 Tax=Leptospira kmetyi TaxID=408139 RepID=A0AAD0XNJ5_9LEPT|nr:hypothetical protein [Leptospira kmetyi]AYV54082.1 hypothetical protein EFP84_00215 [Leptospira kmetyi]
MDFRLRNLDRYFPNVAISHKIANFQNFALRALSRSERKEIFEFPSQAKAIARIQKDFIIFLKNHSTRRPNIQIERNYWKYAEIDFEASMYKIAYNFLNRWKTREHLIVQEMNSLEFKKIAYLNKHDIFTQSPSIISSDLEVFVLKNRFLEKRKVSSWYQVYRTVIRQLNEMKSDIQKLEPNWYNCWRRINREYFNRLPASWKSAEYRLRQQFEAFEAERVFK